MTVSPVMPYMRVALIILLAAGLSTPASSQGLSIPPRQDSSSPTGVSYGSGSFTYGIRDLSIGGEFPQGLSFDRTYMSNLDYGELGGLGWIHNWSGRITLDPMEVDEGSPLADPRRVPYLYNVTVGGKSVGFVGGSSFPPTTGHPQGVYQPITPSGASLVYTGTTPTNGNYVFTDSDGSVVNFVSGGQPRRIQDWTMPDGTRLEFGYDPGAGLRSVISNRGYAILIEPAVFPGAWKVCAVNATQHVITATSTCPVGAQSVTYSYTNTVANPYMRLLASATDANGQTTTYGYSGDGNWASLVRLTCITLPGQSTCQIQNSYSGCFEYEPVYDRDEMRGAYVTAQSTASGETYSYVYAFTDPTKCVGTFSAGTTMTVNGTAVTHVYPNSGSVPSAIIDPLNRGTNFSYLSGATWASEPAELAGVTNPLGDAISNYHDARGNVVRQVTSAIPGSGLPDLESTAVYPATCGATDRRICNKPTSVTDTRGNTTDYTYDPAHGGVLTETGPAVSGVRPQTRHSYAQRYAWIMASGGGYVQAATPVWVRTSTSLCRTSAATGNPVSPCAVTGDEVLTQYDYGPNAGPNNLLLRGQTVTADGVTLRTCYGYDAQGNRISETQPNAGLTSCS